MAMKRKREVQPPLSAFAARRKAAAAAAAAAEVEEEEAAEAARRHLLVHTEVVQDDESELAAEVEESFMDQSPADSDQEQNSFAVLASRAQSAEDIHASRSALVDAAEIEARFVPKLHERDETEMILGLSYQESVTIHGFNQFKVLEGSVEIFGAILTQDSDWHLLATSKTSSLPVLQAVSEEVLEQSLFETAVVALVAFKRDTSGLRDVLEQYPVGRLCLYPLGNQRKLSVHPVNATALSTNQSWRTILSDPSKSSGCTLFVGPKSVGKSTLAKSMLNRFLSSSQEEGEEEGEAVYYLDLDPGQPEFNVPGTISAFLFTSPIFSGPAFQTLQIPLRAHWLGESSPKEDPAHYLACITDLVKFLQRHRMNDERIIVNTPGWVKGTGLELLLGITGILESWFPQELSVVHMGKSDYVASVPFPVRQCDGHYAASPPGMCAADIRTLNLTSYFHRSSLETWSPEYLTSANLEVWEVPFTEILGVCVMREELETRDLIAAINGTIVAVVAVDQEFGESCKVIECEAGLNLLRTAGYPMPADASSCLGLAIVQGLDLKRGIIKLITPLLPEQLDTQDQIVLTTGSIEVPSQLLTGGTREADGDRPYVTYQRGEGIGWQSWHVRRNIGRRVRNT